jgi:CubicO group peptidase (beta-lactamase class C family)
MFHSYMFLILFAYIHYIYIINIVYYNVFILQTARDWTKMGELFMNRGQHNGLQIIDEDFLAFAAASHPRSGGHYGGQLWLNPGRATEADDELLQAEHPIRSKNGWLKAVLPHDAYYMSGHDGQSVFVLPSDRLVITRLGFTKESDNYTNALLTSLMTCVSSKV